MLSTITARLTKKNDDYIASITGGMGTIDKNTGELRSTFDVLQDLSKAWEGLTSVEKQELTETVAGKTQRALFTALMQNFSTAVGATEAALNSEGSAAIENEKRMNSLQGKVQQLQSAWQSLATSTVNSDFVKGILSVTTGFIKAADAAGGLLPIITSILSVFLMFKSQDIGKRVEDIGNSFISLINGFKIMKQQVTGAAGANVIYLGSAESASVATTGFAATATSLSLALGGLTAVISLVVMGINAFDQAQENALKKAQEQSDAHAETAQSLEELRQKYEDLQGAEDEESKKELLQVEKQLSEQLGDTTLSLGENSQAYEENIKKIDDKIKAEKDLAAALASTAMKGTTLSNFWDNLHDGMSKTEVLANDVGFTWKTATQNIFLGAANLWRTNEDVEIYGNTLKEVTDNLGKYLTEQSKKNDMTRSEKTALDQANAAYEKYKGILDEVTPEVQKYWDSLQAGNEISKEQEQAIINVGIATQEQIDKVKNGEEVYLNQSDALSAYTERIYEAQDAVDNWSNKLNENIDQMVNYGENLDILKTAQEELANSGSITAETFQSITENGLLDYLQMVDGQLTVNTNSFMNSTEQIKANALANLEASTYEQIRAVVLEDMKNKETDAGNAATTASGQLASAGASAQEMGAKMLAASSDVATLTAQLNELNKAEGGSGEVGGDVAGKVQNILNQAQKTKSFIESWKPSTSSSARKSSGGSSRKSGGSGRKSGSGSKSSSKSTKEEYKAEIDALYSYKNALDNAKDAVDRLNDALKDTDNFNEQEKILRQLIDATNNQINKTNELKNAQTSQMNDYINQLRAQGFAIDYNASKNELFINNMQHLANFSGDTAKNLEKLIKKTQDLNDDNRSLDSSVRDLTGDVKDYYEQLEKIPEKKLKKFNELMEDFQQSRLDQIQNQIDDIQHEMDNDERIKALEQQIEALENENDELDKQKELEEKILAVEEAKEKLANARKQKTLQVYRAGQGFVWESDIDSIKDAADELKDAQDDLNEKIKQDKDRER